MTRINAPPPGPRYHRHPMMTATVPAYPLPTRSTWSLVRPREHGSWSLALEPVALSLIVAPSGAGVALALAVLLAFFARRPLQRISADHGLLQAQAIRVALALIAAAVAALAIAVWLGGAPRVEVAVPLIACAAVFAVQDRRGQGRSALAEMAGAAAFGCVPALFASLAGQGAMDSWVLAAIMLLRALPTVVLVRQGVRSIKGKPGDIRLGLVAGAAGLALASLAGLAISMPRVLVCAAGLVLLKNVVLAFWIQRTAAEKTLLPRFSASAKRIGIAEAIFGAAYVITLALAVRLAV